LGAVRELLTVSKTMCGEVTKRTKTYAIIGYPHLLIGRSKVNKRTNKVKATPSSLPRYSISIGLVRWRQEQHCVGVTDPSFGAAYNPAGSSNTTTSSNILQMLMDAREEFGDHLNQAHKDNVETADWVGVELDVLIINCPSFMTKKEIHEFRDVPHHPTTASLQPRWPATKISTASSRHTLILQHPHWMTRTALS
jgi:hypothetical protein